MADVTLCTMLKCICLFLVLGSAQCLDVITAGSTRRPPVSCNKASPRPKGPREAVTEGSLSVPTYRVINSSGDTCALLTVDALLAVHYTNMLQEQAEIAVYVPGSAHVSGNCEDEGAETLTLAFKNITLQWSFAKTSDGERWYVGSIRLSYTSLPSIRHPIARVTLETPPGEILFPTPVGKAFESDEETTVELSNFVPNSNANHTDKLIMRELKLHAFM